jgi:hypothetical protein
MRTLFGLSNVDILNSPEIFVLFSAEMSENCNDIVIIFCQCLFIAL